MTREVESALIQQLSEQFDEECQRRHAMGQEKYGPVRFLEVNAAAEAMAEVVDLANYARYLWIKLALLTDFDPSQESNSPSFATEDNAPVEIDFPTDTNSNASTPKNTGFFNPHRRIR